ncbi:MAG: hypothetical protein WCC22_00170 [Terriglobales bacterium]
MAEKAEQKDLYRAYLTVAVFCDRVLTEADGTMSIIRVIDRFNVPGTTPEMIPTVLNFTLLILFRAGFLRGKQTVGVRPISPDGETMPSWSFPVLFEGDNDRGCGLGAQLNLTVNKEGLYWFDVYLNDELVTRMPLRVVYQQGAIPTAAG